MKSDAGLARKARCLCVALITMAVVFVQAIEYEESYDTIMSERAFRKLAHVHELMADGKYAEATENLTDMENGRPLSPYESALVLQTHGFIHLQQARYQDAIGYFEECIATDALPQRAQQGMLYSLSGLYASEARWLDTANTLERWLQAEPSPPAEAYILVASAYTELKRYRDALPFVEKAIAAHPDPIEDWYQLAIAVYFETRAFAKAADTARAMIERWPANKSYWQMLQWAYQEMGDDIGAMSALELGYRQGVLVESSDIVNLVSMKLYLDAPYQAGALLERELTAGRVVRSTDHLRLLLGAWETAREFDKAIAVIDELAVASADGRLFLRKAQLFAERNNWRDVVVAADQALAQGGMSRKERGNTLLLKGVAQVEQDQNERAGQSFRQALEFGGRVAEEARSWLSYLEDQAG